MDWDAYIRALTPEEERQVKERLVGFFKILLRRDAEARAQQDAQLGEDAPSDTVGPEPAPDDDARKT